MAFFKKIKDGLKKTREGMISQIDVMLNSFTKIDDEFFDELEELLVASDIGIHTAMEICDNLKVKVKEQGIKDPKEIKTLLKEIIANLLSGGEELTLDTKPSIILVIGVNGVGKTTTIGKLAALLQSQGKSVLLGAADTFRAGAIEQLQIWAERAKTDIVRQEEGSDPAAVVFDSIAAAKKRGMDIIICDTAGRLHNKKHLMDELAKINRIIDRELPEASKEVLLVLDATTGQNAVNQAREFKNATGITGIILTKLDGTAKGGVVLAIRRELDVPVKFIGVGEQIDDLQPFIANDFANALFPTETVEEPETEPTTDTVVEPATEIDEEPKTVEEAEPEAVVYKENTAETVEEPQFEPTTDTVVEPAIKIDEEPKAVEAAEPEAVVYEENTAETVEEPIVASDTDEAIEKVSEEVFDDDKKLTFIIATNNPNKLKEMKRILDPLNVGVCTAKDIGINLDDVEETGSTFDENATIKARAAYELSGMPVIADDSGLSVDALGGAPGIYSARYAGEGATDRDKIDKLLNNMQGVKERKRKAHFTTAICCILPNGEELHISGKCKGKIAFSPKGENGFGYDPIFIVNDGRSFAELTDDEKDRISHRGNALRKFKDKLERKLKKID